MKVKWLRGLRGCLWNTFSSEFCEYRRHKEQEALRARGQGRAVEVATIPGCFTVGLGFVWTSLLNQIVTPGSKDNSSNVLLLVDY